MNRILIAEDEPRIASFLEKGLRAKGYATTTTTNGLKALSLALEDSFDLLLLDLGLPDKDGLTVLEELRGQGATFPIIIMTARHSIQDKLTGFKKGADDYITKPFRFAELVTRIRQQMPTSGQAMEKDYKID
ncbi:MAG: response regulator [Xenococcaceae cyanobacterium MO_188.B29]|nr:response regulator [Xenococcaceae cyanobacterium MO_188.B29]